ncbi:MAG: acylneuraminate cytidylyltransferase family protein [Campylobacterota bacterium]|nr:acylneuraminate cytidylyltransferase family protein [Campylobacterota bacterium]
MLEDLKILCIIPARGGSKGVPKKNIKLLGNTPLIGYSINSAKESKYINKIIVSTDCEEIKNIAQQFDIEVPFLRPSKFATDKSLDIDYIEHTLDWLQENENYIPDYIVLLRPTTPIRDVLYIDEAILKMKNNDSNSLRSAHEVSESPFKWFKIKDNRYQTICNEYTLDDTNKPRQSFEKVYIPNGYVDIIKPDNIKQENKLYGDDILSFISPFSYEIDTIEDFEFIEYKISKQGND